MLQQTKTYSGNSTFLSSEGFGHNNSYGVKVEYSLSNRACEYHNKSLVYLGDLKITLVVANDCVLHPNFNVFSTYLETAIKNSISNTVLLTEGKVINLEFKINSKNYALHYSPVLDNDVNSTLVSSFQIQSLVYDPELLFNVITKINLKTLLEML